MKTLKLVLGFFVAIVSLLPNEVFATPSVGTFNCEFTQGSKPTSFYETCADGNWSLYKIKWNSWGAKGADGYGVRLENDCIPDCADGKFHYWRAKVKLTSPKVIKGKIYLTQISWWQVDSAGKKVVGGKSGGWNLYKNFRLMGGKA